jgi:hypothetical protein
MELLEIQRRIYMDEIVLPPPPVTFPVVLPGFTLFTRNESP